MIESLHHVIDQLTGVFLALLGEVEIEHGGFELSMAHVTLDDAQVDTGFEEMSGVGMTKGMDRDSPFTDGGSKLSVTESALDAAFGHGIEGLFGACSAAAKSWEKQMGMAVSAPIAA